MNETLNMVQIQTPTYSFVNEEGKEIHTYSTLGLATDGNVYRYDAACKGWIRYSMAVATCTEHRR
jgi:hypothetical protein